MRTPLQRLPHAVRLVLDWVLTIAFAIAIVVVLKTWVVNPYRIPSSSMEPTLHCARPGFRCEAGISDRVLAARFLYHFRAPERGDVVVFTTPPKAAQVCGAGGTYVKRLIALPGERWQETDGIVYIDGKRLDEPYIDAGRRDHDSYPARRIPAGHYFFMGDNRQYSCDSRRWGSVPRTNLIGKVFATYWPPQRIGIR